MTPLVDVSAAAGRPLFLKCENMQPAGAFKIRGAYNMVAQLSDENGGAASSPIRPATMDRPWRSPRGELGAPAVVVMPTTAPKIKVEGAKGFGAEVIFAGTTSLGRKARAEAEAASRGLTIVPPFDHEWIVAGQGTRRARDSRAVPDVASVVVPIGGGGLAAGVASRSSCRARRRGHWRRARRRRRMRASLDAGRPVTLPRTASVADGLMPVRPGDLTFDLVQPSRRRRRHRGRRRQIVAAVLWAFSRAKIVAEPSGAASIAAVLSGVAPTSPGPIVAIVSGGNIGGGTAGAANSGRDAAVEAAS